MTLVIDRDTLRALELDVEAALRRGQVGSLPVIGSGEISVVLGVPADQPTVVAKRLPPFPTVARAERAAALIDRYVEVLRQRDVHVAETQVHLLDRPDGSAVLYCCQPALPADTLAVQVLGGRPDRADEVLGQIVATAARVVGDTVGLDAQLSNWAIADGRLAYLDITTPLLRAEGRSQLDTEVLVASLPWALRPAVRRVVVPGILDRYHDVRTVVLDLAANLWKERLDHLVPVVLAHAAPLVHPALTEAEVRRDYRSDARTWAALQAVRRADRWWQQRVRRRPYPFLLPDRIER